MDTQEIQHKLLSAHEHLTQRGLKNSETRKNAKKRIKDITKKLQDNINSKTPETGSDITELMASLIIDHKRMASNEAWIKWHICSDPDEISSRTAELKDWVNTLRNRIRHTEKLIHTILDPNEIAELRTECDTIRDNFREETEVNIENDHRPTGIVYNEKALYILTDKPIPEDIRINLSFGYKFLSPFFCKEENMAEILAQIEMTIEQAIPTGRQMEASVDIYNILKNRDPHQRDNNKQWLKFINDRTNSFLSQNEDILATKSDKGGHTVVMDVIQYETKLDMLLRDHYIKIPHDPLLGLINKEKFMVNWLRCNKKTRKLVQRIAYEPDTLGISKFYGLPKIHKQDQPLRPITAMRGCVGYTSSKILAEMLGIIFPTSDIHIKDSFQFVKFINNTEIKEDDILVSFDVVSMFTSIPFALVKQIIMNKQERFRQLFDIQATTLESIVDFTLRDCTYFTALNQTYQQLNGLPMGSCASPIVARIVMDEIIKDLTNKIPDITFIKVFVDDTIAAINRNSITIALETLNGFRPNEIKFTMERENEEASLNFLNVTLTRETHTIKTNWHRKYFYSGRILNYYSSHKRTTIMNTAVHFIETVLELSDAQFFNSNREKVINTLRDNCFPETLIITLMNNHYTYMRNTRKDKHTKAKMEKFVIFPHSVCESRKIKRILHRHMKPGVTLAESTKNTKTSAITNKKTVTPKIKRKNQILISKCQCGKKVRVTKTKFNETCEIALERIHTTVQNCNTHYHAYKKTKIMRGLFYSNQTTYLLRYIQWKHNKNIDTLKDTYEFPNPYLRKLVSGNNGRENNNQRCA